MRYLVVGSFKGKFNERLPGFAKDERIDTVVSLGDFKTLECAAAAYDFFSAYPTIEVPGYRDLVHARMIEDIESRRKKNETMPVNKKHNEALEFFRSEKALAALKAPVEATRPCSFVRYFSLDKARLGNTFKTAVSYAPLACTNGSKNEEQEWLPQHFRCHLLDREDYIENFKEMEKLDLSIMIVSEGSEQRYVRYSETNLVGAHAAAKAGDIHKLEKDALHLINPGDVVSGHLAIIDTEAVEDGVVVPYLTFYALS